MLQNYKVITNREYFYLDYEERSITSWPNTEIVKFKFFWLLKILCKNKIFTSVSKLVVHLVVRMVLYYQNY